jgi:hypothetical protein
VKPEKKPPIGRGIGIGFGVFALLSALTLLTPLRAPLLASAGRDTPALAYRLQAQRDTMDALQQRASETQLSPAERASLEQVRNDYVATRERIDARVQMNARFTLLGLFDWIRDLFPWLLAFGLALPVLGGLIGAQVKSSSPVSRVPDGFSAAPAAAPIPSTPPAPPRPTAPVRPAYVHPAAAAAKPLAAMRPLPGSPVILPGMTPTPAVPPAIPAASEAPPVAEAPKDWGFRHQPTPLESRPRVKLPPVRSPSVLNERALDEDPDETLPAS